MKITVCKGTNADVHQLGRTIAHAFQDDPALAWAVPDAQRRERFGPLYFQLLIENMYLPKGEIYMTKDGAAGALWAPPGKWQASIWSMLALLPVMVRACGGHLPRALRMQKLMETKHKEQRESHYYLAYVGTDPASQGKGYGTALLTHMLRRCDAECVPAYLEASSPRNQALYYRHGFKVIEELIWPGGGPPFWRMWRTPR
jgi:ribosomal protein S18 acetylase RimI-like enzyme